jgi:hypothetical protein
MNVDPQQFAGKPLLLIETTNDSVNDYSIRCAGHLVGRIMRSDLAGSAESWLWTVTGPYLSEALRTRSGRTVSPVGLSPEQWAQAWQAGTFVEDLCSCPAT